MLWDKITGPGCRVRLRTERHPQSADPQVAKLHFDCQFRTARKSREGRFEFKHGGVVFFGCCPDDPGGLSLPVDGVLKRLLFISKSREHGLQLQFHRRVFGIRIQWLGDDLDFDKLKTAIAANTGSTLRQRFVCEGIQP